MPAQKNQHYVPRCVLQPFTLNTKGAAIKLFNLGSQKFIKNAPAKNQCSKDYFYGKDLILENILKNIEGDYARIVKQVEINTPNIDLQKLKLFLILQTRRTVKNVAETLDLLTKISYEVYKASPKNHRESISHKQAILHSMKLALDLRFALDDLKLIFLKNISNTNFIISDNPAIVTNRFYFEKLKIRKFGLKNSGILLTMPLGPRFCVLLYDIGIYTISIPSGTNIVDVRNPRDVLAFNELQLLHADQNVYFSSNDDCQSIQKCFENISKNRKSGFELTSLNRDPSKEIETYTSDPNMNNSGATEKLIITSAIQPMPINWPDLIKYRTRPSCIDTKSAAGYVRPRINNRNDKVS